MPSASWDPSPLCRLSFLLSAALPLLAGANPPNAPRPIKVLFLGDAGHHRPAERFRQIQPILAARGIELRYTDQADALSTKGLAAYDGLLVYANLTTITPEQEKALLAFVESGKGFIPVHCASYCFHNSLKYIELVGAQFQRHGTGVFRTTIAAPDHPVMRGFSGFESWDETYVHTRHNTRDRTVLEYRAEPDHKEPWTWVRTQGRGRVFYTAWGHDERTWGHPGFQNLLERGIRWAVGRDPAAAGPYIDRPVMAARRTDVKPFEYVPARVPFYPASQTWGVTGKPFAQMQKPLEPAESHKHFVVPEGFEVQLFASEPDLGGKPICMNWDERGRLWVAVTRDYPNQKQPPGQGHDRIVICEDTHRQGRADKFTIFADHLSLPTSLAFSHGGVIVHQPPETLFLRDTNGDDVADERRVLFRGWSTDDTHAGPSNLHYGLDNWFYGMVGYAGFDGVVGGEHVRFSQGFYRFKPDGSRLEFLRSTNNNSWGVGLSEEGSLFGSTANGNPSVYLPIPNRYYEAVRGWSPAVLRGIAGNPPMAPITDRVRQVDYHGHFTAAAGHDLYTARTYPRDYWNRAAFVAEPTGHLLATFVLTPEGASYRSRMAWNLLASDDEWSAPIAASVGPDGHVWVIDWYNYIVQHNPTPPGWTTGKGGAYETELRDKTRGRIYRVVYKAAKPTPAPNLGSATPEQLIGALRHDNMLWRLHAQRLLVERGQRDVTASLIALAQERTVDAIGLNAGAIHALWTLHGLGLLDGSDQEATAAALAALRHPSAGVRRAAVQILPRRPELAGSIIQSGVLDDVDAQVRLASLLALAEMPPTQAGAESILSALRDDRTGEDPSLRDAATCAAARHAGLFLSAVLRAGGPQAAPPAMLGVIERTAEHLARGGQSSLGSLWSDWARAPAPLAEAVVVGLSRGWPSGQPMALNPQEESMLVSLFQRLSARGQGQLMELAGRWGTSALAKQAGDLARRLYVRAADESLTDASRVEAAGQLIRLRATDAKQAEQVLGLVTPQTSVELAQGLLEAVGQSEAKPVAGLFIERLPSWTPAVRSAAIRALLGRTDWTDAFLDAASRARVQWTDLSLDQRQSLLQHPNREIAARARELLTRGGGLPDPDRQKVVDELMALTKVAGDASAGKLVFKNTCAKCHTHSGEGTRVGPDLTGMAVHPKTHLLVEILDPSRSVEGNYRQYVVTTKAGLMLSGLLSSETKTTVELLDAEGKRQVLLRDDIDTLRLSNKSLMPEGFEKQLSRTDLVNLLEFLTQRGRYLPLPLDKAATAISTRGMFYDEASRIERLVFPDWSPKTFRGVPFQLVDPQGGRAANVILLFGPQGKIPPRMPKSATVPCNTSATAIHLLSGISGWGFPASERGTVTLVVRLHYADGTHEDHPLQNGIHFADYIRRVDVPGSRFAFNVAGRQVRYLAIQPKRKDKIDRIEFVKGPDDTAPVIVAATVQTGE